jgi:hypothetical protein
MRLCSARHPISWLKNEEQPILTLSKRDDDRKVQRRSPHQADLSWYHITRRLQVIPIFWKRDLALMSQGHPAEESESQVDHCSRLLVHPIHSRMQNNRAKTAGIRH